MSDFRCSFPGCGRRFREEELLERHFQHRHSNNPSKLDDSTNLKDTNYISDNIVKADKSTLKQIKEELLAQEKEMGDQLSKFDEKEEEITFNISEITESQKRLTENFIRDKAGNQPLEDITQLVLRGENLLHFDDANDLFMDKLCSLEYLALSHNKLTLANGIGKLPNLIELNINFNLVEDITPLNDCLNLEKLYASNNRIRDISGIKDLTNLKCIGLFKNKIHNFEEAAKTLAKFPSLQELDLEGNPCTRKFTYKYDLLYYVKVEKLDGERINQIDYDLAKSFKGEEVKKGNFEEPEEEKSVSALQRPGTAPGRAPRGGGNFANKLRDRTNPVTQNSMMNIPENVNTEKLAEMEQEIESLRERLNQAEVELEESRGRESILQMEKDHLTNKMSILNVEASNAYALMDINKQLKNELHSYKNSELDQNGHKDLRIENFQLQQEIMELLKENNELKEKLREDQPNGRFDLKALSNTRPKEIDTEERLMRNKDRAMTDNRSSSLSQDTKTLYRIRSGQASPKLSGPTRNRPTAVKVVRGTSSEPKKLEEAKPVLNQEGSARKIIPIATTPRTKVLVPTKPKEEQPATEQEGDDEEVSDAEIEALLIRSSLQLSQLRSELRNFDFNPQNEVKRYEESFSSDFDQGNYYEEQDSRDTRDTSMRVNTPQERNSLRK